MSSSGQQPQPLPPKVVPSPMPATASSPGGSRRGSSNGPTISIENVELLEADRQQDEKRGRRGSRQQEAAAAAAAAAIQGEGGGDAAPPPAGMYGTAYGAFSSTNPADASMMNAASRHQQQQPQPSPYYGAPPHPQGTTAQDPSVPSSYFYPNYVPAPAPGQQQPPHGLAPRQEPHYGMTYQGGFQTAGSGFYSPPSQPPTAGYGGTSFYPPGVVPAPGAAGAAGGGVNEYSNMLASGNNSMSSFEGNYGSLSSIGGDSYQASSSQTGGYPRLSPPGSHVDMTGTTASNRGLGALTIDDIEKSFNAVVSQQYPDPSLASSSQPPPPKQSPENLNSRPPSSAKDEKQRIGKSPTHRRSGSNASTGSTKHRRSGSTGNLPPAGPPSRSPAPSSGNRKKPDTARRRSLSGTFVSSNNSTGSHHRRPSFSRNQSATDLQSVGGQSVTSHHSVVSDISKSALFQGVTEEGHVQLHFPYEAVRLINNKNMEFGRLYMQEIPAAQYELYHLAAEELTNWEHRMDQDNRFNKASNEGKELIPPTFYAIRIDDDLYRRVLDEIADSHQMPCGLFFCGHHEDVSNPSIRIAMTTVALLFIAMGIVAFVVQS